MKKLLKRIVVEIYEYTPEVVVNEPELQKVVSDKINNTDIDKARKLAAKRIKEFDDYFGWNMPWNKEKRNGTNKTESSKGITN